MSSFGKFILLLLVNILVSVLATLAVLYYWENIRNAEKPYILATLAEPGNSETLQEAAGTPEIDYGILATSSPAASQAGTQAIETKTENEITATPPGVLPPVRGSLVTISQAIGIGDVNAEAIQITSTSDTAVSLNGWTMEDADGNVFTFPDIQLIRRDIFIEVYSRSGHNTPFELYWGQATPVWQAGETIVIRDAGGNAQATYRIP